MAEKPKRKKSGPITKAFIKGLSIILPAIITIAIFAWVWDILRVYVVELTIKAIDEVDVFAPRPMTQAELTYIDARYFADPLQADPATARPNTVNAGISGAAGAAAAAVSYEQRAVAAEKYRVEANLRRYPEQRDLPTEYRGMTPPGQDRSLLQLILDTNAQENGQNAIWKRDYDQDGRVISYNWFDYLLSSVLGLALVVLLGFLARNFFGRKFVSLLEWFVTRVPVVKSIYPHAKQLVEFFFTDSKPIEFNTVAVIEYPRHGLWSIAFVTGAGLKAVQEATGRRMVTVYVPSSPAPMTGYCMVMPAEDVIQVDVSVEDAMKFVISGGVLAPQEQLVKPASGAQYALTHDISEQIRKRQTTMLKKSRALQDLEEALQELEDKITGADKTEASAEDETREADAPPEKKD